MSQDLPVTSYALLGLLSFGEPLTGYELKQRADRTLRFYWTSPAMSQVYSELDRLHRHKLVRLHRPSGATEGRGTAYSLNAAGKRALHDWLAAAPVDFPVLKHPVALRLLMGALVEPAVTERLLRDHLDALAAEKAALQEVRISLEGADADGEPFRYPALVADWGLSYFAHEEQIIADLLRRLEADR